MNRIRKLFVRQLLWLSTLAVFLLPGPGSAQTLRTERLELVRSQIVFPELTAEQKRTLAQQAQLFLRDLYVHRYHKPEYYHGLADAGVAIQGILDRADQLTTQELEVSLNRLFSSQRDLHLNYYYPAPHNLYTSFLPLTLVRTAGPENFFEIRVSAVNAEQFAQFAPGQRVPALGDQVIRYNGRPVLQETQSWLPIVQGANEYGGFNRALRQLAFISHLRRDVPELNQVTLEMKAYATGQTYRIVLPWLTQWTEPLPAQGPMRRPAPPPAKRFDLGIDDFQEEYNAFLQNNHLQGASVYPSNPTAEPRLTWGKITNRDGTFGYLRLASFRTVTGTPGTVGEIRRLLLGELAKTDGLIFDVRDNGGGSIGLADVLSQLFTRNSAKVNGFRLLNSDLNRLILNDSQIGIWEGPEFQRVINEVKGTGRIYSDTVQFETDAEANLLGQVYYQPVALMASAGSYSATDEFVCSMQDNGAALIYGEDPKTGAGGANVMTHQDFVDNGPAGAFTKLPLDHTMRVAWRQSVRFSPGPNAGKLIEDYGCAANIDVSLTASDLISGGARQLSTVTHSLAQRSKHYQAYARGEQSEAELYLARASMSYGIYVARTPYVEVYVNDVLRNRMAVKTSAAETLVRYDLPGDLPSGQATRLTFVGVDRSGKPIWNLKRRITVLDQKVILDASGLQLDFSTASSISPLVVVNQGSAPQDGWNLVTPNLQVGYAPNYANGVDSDAILFLDLRGRTAATLEFGVELDTEPDYDFVEVSVTNNASKAILLRSSGPQSLAYHTFDLAAFAGQDNVALHFRFTSDTNITMSGARIPRITIR